MTPATELETRAQAEAQALADELAARGASGRRVAIVLGSGLGALVDRLTDPQIIRAQDLEHLPGPRVSGHAGEIVLGELGGVPILVQSGRVHLYEDRSAHEVTRAVRAFACLGVRALVLTNAAGGLVPEHEPGTLLRLTDHINLQGRSPLFARGSLGAQPYDEQLGAVLETKAAELHIRLESGVYAAMLGPSYETPAEVRALRALGAAAVGMSTAAEASAAVAAGLRVVALSCIANPAAGLAAEPLHHADVLEVMRRSGNRLALLLERAMPEWASLLG